MKDLMGGKSRRYEVLAVVGGQGKERKRVHMKEDG